MQTLPKLLSGSVHTPTPEPTSQGHTHRHAPLGGAVLTAHSCSSQHTAPRGPSQRRSCTEHSGTQSKFGEPRHSTLLRLEML